MKTLLGSTALGGLLVVMASMAAGQTLSSPFPATGMDSSIMVAEGGGNRLLRHQGMLRDEFSQSQAMKADTGERFTRMLEEQPSAAGPRSQADEQEAMGQPMRRYNSLIERNRAEFGWH